MATNIDLDDDTHPYGNLEDSHVNHKDDHEESDEENDDSEGQEENEEEDDDDDEDDEDDDDEEEDDMQFSRRKRPYDQNNQGRGGKRRRKNDMSRFFEEQAEEDEEESGSRVYRSREEESMAANKAYERIRHEFETRRRSQLQERSAAEIAAQYTERVTSQRETGTDFEGEDYAEAALAKQAAVPSLNDPKLWMIKCKDGSEKEIMIALMNKYITKASVKNPLGIYSAVCTAKGVIFVEAYREAQVKNAVMGIQNLYGWRADAIQLVPIKDMTAALNVRTQRKAMKPGQWVRLTRGHYKDDLARIVDVLDGGAKVVIQAIPRIDLTKLRLSADQRKARFTRSTRPPQRFFNRDEILSESQGTATVEARTAPFGMRCEYWAGNYYRDGFLYKELRRTYVDQNATPPTLDELQKFRSSDTGADDASDAALAHTLGEAVKRSSGAVTLAPGDNVVINKGDWRGVEGRVLAINEDEGTFSMQPSAEMVRELGVDTSLFQQVPLADAVKNFVAGDHVKIVGGVHSGETGTVLIVKPAESTNGEPTGIVLMDTGDRQAEVFLKDMRLTTEVASTAASIEGYELYDLVELPPPAGGQRQVGVIVRISQRELTLLMENGQTKQVTLQQLRGKANRRSETAITFDSQSRQLSVGDIVKVTAGDHRGIDGTIKHMDRKILFLHTYKRTANAGMIVVYGRQVLLSGAKARTNNSLTNVGGAQNLGPRVLGTVAGKGTGGPGGRGRGSTGAVDDEWRGYTVKIVRGRHRNKLGMVKMTTDDLCSVELHSGQKQVKIKKEHLVKVGDRTGMRNDLAGAGGSAFNRSATAAPMHPAFGARTPAIGGGATPAIGEATPAFGGQTPAYRGSQTPAYGGQTPAYGGQTPAYGGQTPAYGGQTPAYGGQTPAYGGQTPAYGGQTPAYGGQTPAYGGQTPAYGSSNGNSNIWDASATPVHSYASEKTAEQSSDTIAERPKWSIVGAVVVDETDGQEGVLIDNSTMSSNQTVQIRFKNGTSKSLPLSALHPVKPSEGCTLLELSSGEKGSCMAYDQADDKAVYELDGEVRMRPTNEVIVIETV